LAAYGKPRFFDRAFVGNWYDLAKAGLKEFEWADYVLIMARQMGYDMAPLANRVQIMAP